MITSEFKKKIADSWFSYLQIQICRSFELLEITNYNLQKENGVKIILMKVVEHLTFWQEEKFLIRLGLISQLYLVYFQKV